MPRPDGSQMALEVLIFPEAMRGAGEGHRPWDLMPESTMTNATVADTVQKVEGHTLTLTYKDGQKTIVVPAGGADRHLRARHHGGREAGRAGLHQRRQGGRRLGQRRQPRRRPGRRRPADVRPDEPEA